MTPELNQMAARLLDRCKANGLTLTAAESCTGGLIMATLTAVPGSSAAVDRGYVTYSNAAKTDMLGVPAPLIERHGAVSEEVARAMAEGALERSGAGLAMAVTGIAGPDGGSEEKPVGLVHIAAARKGRATTHARCLFGGIGRDGVRTRSVEQALRLAETLVGG